MAGQITISGLSAGELAGQRILGPITLVGKAVIGETIVMPLAPGDNTFAVPLESVAVMIVPPLGNSVSIKLRTNKNSGDAGLPLGEGPVYSTLCPFIYTFPSSIPTSLILHAESATVGGVSITFI